MVTKRRKRKKKSFLQRLQYKNILVLALVLLALIFVILMAFKSCGQKESIDNKNKSSASQQVTDESIASGESTADASADASATNTESEVPAVTTPESEEVAPVDVLSNALFIGDSRMQGFIIYNNLTNVTAYTATGLSVETAMTKAVATDDAGNACTIPQALQGSKKYDRVYIKLGINELGWNGTKVFIEKYKALIAKIKEFQPQAMIIVEGILPVTEAKAQSSNVFNNVKVNEFNTAIKQMTEDEGIRYLDCSPPLVDENGNLIADSATDGIHLTKEYCEKWLNFIKENP